MKNSNAAVHTNQDSFHAIKIDSRVALLPSNVVSFSDRAKLVKRFTDLIHQGRLSIMTVANQGFPQGLSDSDSSQITTNRDLQQPPKTNVQDVAEIFYNLYKMCRRIPDFDKNCLASELSAGEVRSIVYYVFTQNREGKAEVNQNSSTLDIAYVFAALSKIRMEELSLNSRADLHMIGNTVRHALTKKDLDGHLEIKSVELAIIFRAMSKTNLKFQDYGLNSSDDSKVIGDAVRHVFAQRNTTGLHKDNTLQLVDITDILAGISHMRDRASSGQSLNLPADLAIIGGAIRHADAKNRAMPNIQTHWTYLGIALNKLGISPSALGLSQDDIDALLFVSHAPHTVVQSSTQQTTPTITANSSSAPPSQISNTQSDVVTLTASKNISPGSNDKLQK